MLYLAKMRQEGEDKLWRIPSKKGLYGDKSFYSVMGCHDGFRFSWKSVWLTKFLLRMTYFVWSAALEKILIMNNFSEATRHCG
jgi:hypothetical protein